MVTLITKEEIKLKEIFISTTSSLSSFVPKIQTTIEHLKTEHALQGNHEDVELRKKKVIDLLARIKGFTQGKITSILKLQESNQLQIDFWNPIKSLVTGQVHEIEMIQTKVEQYVHAPTKTLWNEIEEHLKNLNARQEEELVQLRNVSSVSFAQNSPMKNAA